jgi:hypothetical protein
LLLERLLCGLEGGVQLSHVLSLRRVRRGLAQSFLQCVERGIQAVATQASQRTFEAMGQAACLVPMLLGDARQQNRRLLLQFLMRRVDELNEFIRIHERLQLAEDSGIQCFHTEILTVLRTEVPTLNY